MLLITIFVELRAVAGRSRTRAGSPQAVSLRSCYAVAMRRTAWAEHGMTSVNQTRQHCVNQMGKTHKPLADRAHTPQVQNYAAKHRPSIPKNICEPLRVISFKHSSVLPDDGSHTIRKHVGVIFNCLLKLTQRNL